MTDPAPYRNHIAGAWVDAEGGRTFDNLNPADTRDAIGRFAASSEADARAAVAAAQAALAGWRATPIGRRARIVQDAAARLEASADALAAELTREEGKPLAQAKDEWLRSAQTLRFYAVEGQSVGGEVYPNDDPDMLVYSLREPLGVVSVITPWNFPASIPSRKIAPALVAGNTVVFKPSSDAPLTGLRLAQALIDAGLPAGVLNLVTGSASAVGPAITESPAVRAISFTGSTAAGERIHRAAPLTTRVQLELGGKNPLVVMADADLDRAVDLAVKGGLALSGQACTGTSRLLVQRPVHDAFVDRLASRMRALKIGPGTAPGMDLGPLATAAQLDTVLAYVALGKAEATHVLGGDRLAGPGFEHGWYVSPALFTGVRNRMRIAQEEIFGPVLAVIAFEDYAEAVAIANDSRYGLAAAICTRNPAWMHAFERDVEAGTVKINRTTTGNLVNAPFGGLKGSSTSTFRESGRAALEFFTQIKTVYRGV